MFENLGRRDIRMSVLRARNCASPRRAPQLMSGPRAWRRCSQGCRLRCRSSEKSSAAPTVVLVSLRDSRPAWRSVRRSGSRRERTRLARGATSDNARQTPAPRGGAGAFLIRPAPAGGRRTHRALTAIDATQMIAFHGQRSSAGTSRDRFATDAIAGPYSAATPADASDWCHRTTSAAARRSWLVAASPLQRPSRPVAALTPTPARAATT